MPPSPRRCSRLLALATAALVLTLAPLTASAAADGTKDAGTDARRQDPSAGASTPTTLTISGPSQGVVGERVQITARLTETPPGGGPTAVPGVPVEIVRVVDGSPTSSGPLTTGPDGTVTTAATVMADPDDNDFQASYAGDETRAPATSGRLRITPSAAPRPTALQLRGPGTAKFRTDVTLRTVLLADVDGSAAPVAGETVTFWRRESGTWRRAGTARTDAAGVAARSVRIVDGPGSNAFRTTYEGTAAYRASVSGVLTIRGTKHDGRLRLTGPGRVVDETSIPLTLTFSTASRDPINSSVTLFSRARGTRRWVEVATAVTGPRGIATVRVAPRVDTDYRARAAGGSWFTGDVTDPKPVDNLPPGVPVRYPAGAPRPRIRLPPQPRAVGDGPNAVVTGIPGSVWARMQGRSWRPGCLPRTSLRLVRINYWGFDGYRHRGEIVVAGSVAGRVAGAFGDAYRAELPIRAMYLVDRFGYSPAVRGANDYASMAAGNTSGFNCRDVVGRPGVRSPHASGRAIDVNPWENPYSSPRDGWVPNRYWVGRHLARVTNRTSASPMVRVLARNGIRWTYRTYDAHHFDA